MNVWVVGGGIVFSVVALAGWYSRTNAVPALRKRDFVKNMVYVYSFGPGICSSPAASASPFGNKVLAWLRLSGIPHQVEFTTSTGPTGKLPFIELNGVSTGDSSAIIERLKQEFTVDPDAHLSPEQKAVSLAFQRMLEEHFYFILIHFRWDDHRLPYLANSFFAGAPSLIKSIVPRLLARNIRQTVHGQGLGRMPESYIMSRAEKDFEAFSILLGDKPFFFGSKPSSLDAYVYGFLDSMINSGVPIPPIRTLERHRNLIDHLSRFRALLDAKQSE